mgnify:CR=1 FL=1
MTIIFAIDNFYLTSSIPLLFALTMVSLFDFFFLSISFARDVLFDVLKRVDVVTCVHVFDLPI